MIKNVPEFQTLFPQFTKNVWQCKKYSLIQKQMFTGLIKCHEFEKYFTILKNTQEYKNVYDFIKSSDLKTKK